VELTPSQTLDVGRWYPLRPHPVQLRLVTDDVRFKVVPAGRRSGKTERAKRFVVREALRVPGPYFVAAPTRDQVKRIYWQDLKRLSFCSVLPDPPSESELTIKYPNGSSIRLIGLDQPQRIEGSFWKGGIIDEVADTKPEAWAENIAPSLDTVDPRDPNYRAWCWLIGVPEGLNHYYELAEYARTSGDKDWCLYHWKSSDILPADVIDSAKRRMSGQQFRQEYEASFETAAGRIYSDYGPQNYTEEVIKPHEPLVWGHDFNFTPMSSFVGVKRGESLFALDEIVLDSATARQSAVEFVEKFKAHGNKKVTVYGDPAGRAGEKHGHASDYVDIETVLRGAGWVVERRVKAAAPPITARQNSVRAKLLSAAGSSTMFVNVNKAPTLHKGLATVQFKKGSAFIEEQSREQHITTAIGYCVDFEWPVRRENTATLDTQAIPNVNYWGSHKP
jgi:hypothetical protein